MVGFTVDSSGKEPSIPIEEVASYLKEMAGKFLHWNGVGATIREEKQFLSGFKQTDVAVMSFTRNGRAMAPDEQRREAEAFLKTFNENFFVIDADKENIRPMFNQDVGFVTPAGEVGINLELLRSVFAKYPEVKDYLGNEIYSYGLHRRHSQGAEIGSPHASAEASPPPADVQAALHQLTTGLQWGKLKGVLEYGSAPRPIGFGQREVALLSFTAVDGAALPAQARKDEALNFADVLNRFVTPKLSHAMVVEQRDVAMVTDDGCVAVDMDALRFLAQKNSTFLAELGAQGRLYVERETMGSPPVSEAHVDFPSAGQTVMLTSQTRIQQPKMTAEEMEIWLKNLTTVLRMPAGLETLFANTSDDERGKLENVCGQLADSIFLRNTRPDEYARMQQESPNYTEAVEAYADYLMRAQLQRSGKGEVVERPRGEHIARIGNSKFFTEREQKRPSSPENYRS